MSQSERRRSDRNSEAPVVNIRGEAVPAIGFGTFQLTGKDAEEGVAHALEVGYRHIDTASIYRNEVEVGRALTRSSVPREDIFLTTKIRWDSLSADRARKCAEQSLRDLDVAYVDLLLIHWPHPEIPIEETLDVMCTLQREGKARHVGVSNFPPTLLRRAMELAPIFCNQVEYHPLLSQRKLLEMARENDLLLTAYSPLAQGVLTGNSDGAEEALRVLGEIALAHGKSGAQVALRWLLQQENVALIPRSASNRHREANFDIRNFSLTDAEMVTISALDRDARFVRPHWEPDWERD